jgi:hypothetical protein
MLECGQGVEIEKWLVNVTVEFCLSYYGSLLLLWWIMFWFRRYFYLRAIFVLMSLCVCVCARTRAAVSTEHSIIVTAKCWIILYWSKKSVAHRVSGCKLSYVLFIYLFKVCQSMHHRHTVQINQPTRCNSSSSLLLDVYVQLNMFRAWGHPKHVELYINKIII